MKKLGMNTQSGVSVMELVIVLAIAAILLTFAAAQFGRAGDNFHRQNIARELKVSLERARFDSVKRRANGFADMSKVTILSETSFSYTADFNQNGEIDEPGETRTVDFADRGDVRIAGNTLIFPITISFNQQGQITAVDGSGADMVPLFYICNGSCTPSTVTSLNSNLIYVSPTGTVAMMVGGTTVPTFNDPAVTDVDSDLFVNPLLAVWDSTGEVAATTPVPTPTPTSTPTPTPSPSPTTTPLPSSTATPTTRCAYGDKPSSTGCVCTAPMWVRNNGKCQ